MFKGPLIASKTKIPSLYSRGGSALCLILAVLTIPLRCLIGVGSQCGFDVFVNNGDFQELTIFDSKSSGLPFEENVSAEEAF